MRKVVGVMNAETLSEKKLVRAKVIAERYDVTDRCVFLWAGQGRIPSVKIGKTIRFDLGAVVEAIEGKGGAR